MQGVEAGPAKEPSDIQAAVFYRLPAVLRVTGLARSTIYRLMAVHEFPPQVKLAGRAVGWRRTDINIWCDARPTVAD